MRFFCCALLLLATPGMAEETEQGWIQRHFTTTDGMPVSSAMAARIDPDGFLWLATHDGLVRFDGQRFAIFDPASQPAMDSNRVVSLHTDPAGEVYGLTDSGSLLHARSSGIRRVRPDPLQPDAAVLEVREQPFCITAESGLFCRQPDGAFAARVTFDDGQCIRRAIAGSGRQSWLIGCDGAVLLAGDATERPVAVGEPLASLPFDTNAVAHVDGSLVVAQPQYLVHLTIDGRGRMLTPPDDPAGEPPGELLSVKAGEAGRLTVGTTLHVYQLEPATNAWTRLTPAEHPGVGRNWPGNDGVSWISQGSRAFHNGQLALRATGEITDVHDTGDGTVWITTLRDGIYALSRPRVELIDREAGLASDNVYGVSIDTAGRIWLGSLSGEARIPGIVQAVEAGRIRIFNTHHGLPGDNPWAVIAAADGTIHAATYAPGLWTMAAGADRFAAADLPLGLAGTSIRALTFDQRERLWLGGSSGVWMRDDAGWQRQWSDEAGAATVLSIRHARNGWQWYGTTQGLWYRRTPDHQPVAIDELAGVQIRDVYEDRLNAIWASSQGSGLFRLDANTEPIRVVRLGRNEGLPSNSPHTTVEDAMGNLWVNSNQGVFRIDRTDLEQYLDGRRGSLSPLALTQADGVGELEGNGGVQPAVAVDDRGRIHFPTQAGLVGIDPAGISPRAGPPVAVIDRLLADGQEQHLEADPDLPLGHRNVQFQFAAADLHGGASRFRYRLLPLSGLGTPDSEPSRAVLWNDAIDQHATAYPALAPGRYRFEIVAGNSDGLWSEQATTLEFSVPPYWYETLTFRAGLVAAALLALALLIQYRMQRLRRRAVELNRRVDRRTRQLATEKSRVENTLAQLADAHETLEETHAQIAQRNRKLAAQSDRLQALDRFRKQLLADVSHELRTPLMLIELPLSDLDRLAGESWPEAARRKLAIARGQTERLSGLVTQLITLVQAESGQLELRIRRIRLEEFLCQLIESYQIIAQKQSVELRLTMHDPELELYADPAHLTTAMGNLIDNALKYAPEQSRIDVRQHGDSHSASTQLSVQDRGPGFDPSEAGRLFERFYRLPGAPKAGREGLGIGLALAREIAELHGGRISAIGEPDAGASFWIELPLGSSHVAIDELAIQAISGGAPARPEPTPDHTGEQLLLVEDHPELAVYLRERLSEFVPVRVAGSTEEALASIQQARPALLVSDVVLPGDSGMELCARIRRDPALASLPVILISARATDEDRAAGLAAGADDYLVKPFTLDDLLQTIGKAWPAMRDRLQPAVTGNIDDPVLEPALKSLADPEFGVREWAGAVHLSQRQLRRRVTDRTGQSPLAWLREQRLLRVRQLISSGTCKTLAEAGDRCGLENPQYLYRIYRARFGG